MLSNCVWESYFKIICIYLIKKSYFVLNGLHSKLYIMSYYLKIRDKIGYCIKLKG